jgi:hypothetical protein
MLPRIARSVHHCCCTRLSAPLALQPVDPHKLFGFSMFPKIFRSFPTTSLFSICSPKQWGYTGPHYSRVYKSLILNALQKSAYPIESRQYQRICFHTHAHTFPASLLFTSFYKLGRGVYVGRQTGEWQERYKPRAINILSNSPNYPVAKAARRDDRARRPQTSVAHACASNPDTRCARETYTIRAANKCSLRARRRDASRG